MKLQDKERKHPAFDAPAGLAEGLLASGNFHKVEPVIKKPVPNLQWGAHKGPMIGDFTHGPRLTHSCSTCGTSGFAEGPTVHLTIEVRHCGVVDRVPAHVAKKFEALRKEWKSHSRFRPDSFGRLPNSAAAEKQAAELRRKKLADEALRIAKLARA